MADVGAPGDMPRARPQHQACVLHVDGAAHVVVPAPVYAEVSLFTNETRKSS